MPLKHNPHTEIIIIGSGIVGSSVAYHLAKRGCTKIKLFEQHNGLTLASTPRNAAGVRHQWSSKTNILLSKYSIPKIRDFHAEMGMDAELRQVGYLFFIRDPDSWAIYERDAALQHSLGIETQLLSPQEAQHFVPESVVSDLQGAAFYNGDGYCTPMNIRNGYLQKALEMGVTLHNEEAVTSIETHANSFTVHTTKSIYTCETLVNAAGSWSGEIGKMLHLDIPTKPYRRHIYALKHHGILPENLPFTFDVDTGFFMRLNQDILWFGKINPDDPTGFNFEPDLEWMHHVLALGKARFPILEKCALHPELTKVGMYEQTPDSSPILGRHPELPHFVNANGFSGHGIMHSPATGLLTAEEILDGKAHTINIDEFRIERFQNAKIVQEKKVF